MVRRKLADVACGFCRMMFHPRDSTQRFCSKTCFDSFQRAQALENGQRASYVCQQCGRRFSAWVSLKADRNVFCSRECHKAYRVRDHVIKKCKTCGKETKFKPRTSNPSLTRDYCSRSCYFADPGVQRRLRRLNAEQQRGKETSVERMGYALLCSAGVAYRPQESIHKFCVDAFVPQANLIIQFDGDYWHGNPVEFPDPNRLQRRNMQRDQAMDAYLVKCGYSILRFWGSDLKANEAMCLSCLREALSAS